MIAVKIRFFSGIEHIIRTDGDSVVDDSPDKDLLRCAVAYARFLDFMPVFYPAGYLCRTGEGYFSETIR
jgi:hypothetical protein